MSSPFVALGEISTINPPAPRGLLVSDEEVAFVPMAAVSETGLMRVQEHRSANAVSSSLSYFADGDVLVAKITPCYDNNKIALASIDRAHAFGSTEFHVLRPDDRALDASYLVHFLRQDTIREAGIRRMTGSAGQRRVPKAFLEQLEIPLPPLGEQQRIAAVLTQAERLRSDRRRALCTLASLQLATFIRVFGPPDANPRHLPIVQFGDLISSGPTNGLYKPASCYGDGTPILRIGDFGGGRIGDLTALRRLSVTADERETYALEKGDIVINRVNSLEHLGKSALVPELSESTVFESNMMRIRLDRDRIDPIYCVTFLQLPFVKRQILQKAKDAINQSSINQKDVRSFLFTMPPLGEQRRFANAVCEIERLSKFSSSHLKQLDALFGSLQCRAFSGEPMGKTVQQEVARASMVKV